MLRTEYNKNYYTPDEQDDPEDGSIDDTEATGPKRKRGSQHHGQAAKKARTEVPEVRVLCCIVSFALCFSRAVSFARTNPFHPLPELDTTRLLISHLLPFPFPHPTLTLLSRASLPPFASLTCL